MNKDSLVKILGTGNVYQDAEILEAYSKDISFVNPMKPRYVVKPKNKEAIQELVKLANETQTALIPVSSGAPHFRGDTVPSVAGSIIVDLSDMNKIVNVDRPRRVAMVQPGVKFEELIRATAKEGIRINMPLLPRSSKTVVGSMLEREPVTMPRYQWDVEDPMACIEVIFGNGEEFRTGQSAGPGTVEEQWSVGGMQKAPAGPFIASWHRLVQGAQGSVGIVTWASLRCELLPSLQEPFLVNSNNLNKLIEMASWLIRLRTVNECFILNSTNLAAMFADKWPEDYHALKADLPDWTLFYVLAGYEFYPEERISSNIQTISSLCQRLGTEPVKSAGGVSADEMLKMVQKPCADPYWKLRYKGASEDILYLTLNNKIEGQIRIMNELAEKAGYPVNDLGVYIQPVVQGTGVHCEFTAFYDPQQPKKAAQVRGLAQTATKTLMNNGAFFSRPYGENGKMIVNRDAASVLLLNKMKDIFDHNKIMNPGKICW